MPCVCVDIWIIQSGQSWAIWARGLKIANIEEEPLPPAGRPQSSLLFLVLYMY